MNNISVAKDAITMLEVQQKDDYTLIQSDLIAMFDETKSQELYKAFLQKFKQIHKLLHQVPNVHKQINFQKYLVWWWHEGLQWSIFFRAKLEPEILQQITILLQQNMIENTDITIERIYNLALLTEKMVSWSLPLTSVATVQSTQTCFYCGQGGHVLKECTQ